MRLGVISDTHGDRWAIEDCIQLAGHVDAWLHLGDNVRDTKLLEAAGIPVYGVRGNTDFGTNQVTERIVELGGKRLFLSHGHTYGVEAGLTRLYLRAKELGCDGALFGHTHVPFLDEGGDVTLLNPGSPSRPRGGSRRAMGLLTIRDQVLDGELLFLP